MAIGRVIANKFCTDSMSNEEIMVKLWLSYLLFASSTYYPKRDKSSKYH